MASENQNGHSSEDEAFKKHIRQMLGNGSEGGYPSDAGKSQQQGTVPSTNSEVDLSSSDAAIGRSSSLDESPFHPPHIDSSPAGYGVGQFHTYPTTHTAPPAAMAGGSKLDQVKAQVKDFSIDTFRTTKQLFSEIMGKGARTVDPKVDVAISELRVLQATYVKLIDEVTRMQSCFSNFVYTQKCVTNVLGELALREPKLSSDFNMNAESQKLLIVNGEQLLGALNFFLSNMKTMCNRTIQDCLDTAKKYESARLQYDTYRSEHEQTIHSGGTGSTKAAEIRQKFEERKKKYDQLKDDMVIKLQFLEENKSKVVHRQMMLLHNAIAAYFSGNQKQLETVLGQFSVSLRRPNSEPPSWLEK
ncbi:arfaptin-2-like isoform X2 [Watersipora subatra]|uniref:arfaptin-2-like isoform X2 n=1 Tax=Watersipora subatra TaxID=2589382 RepID=UPI00355B2FF7